MLGDEIGKAHEDAFAVRFGAASDQTPLSNAARAARTAASISSGPHAATRASSRPSTGEMQSKVLPLEESTNTPPMNALSRNTIFFASAFQSMAAFMTLSFGRPPERRS